MARDALRPLEGQLVVWSGIAAKATRRGERRDVMLSSVRLWSYDTTIPAGIGVPAAAVDHLWLRLEPADRVPLLRRCIGLGTVRWYARTDGTTDLGLEHRPTISLDALVADLHQHRGSDPRALLQRVEAGLLAIQLRKAYSETASIEWCRELLEAHQALLQQQLHGHPHRQQRHRTGRGRRGFAALLPACPQVSVEAGR